MIKEQDMVKHVKNEDIGVIFEILEAHTHTKPDYNVAIKWLSNDKIFYYTEEEAIEMKNLYEEYSKSSWLELNKEKKL